MKHNDRLDSLIYANLTIEQTKAWKIAHEYSIPYFLALQIRYKTAAGFKFGLERYDDASVLLSLNACIAEEWGEGVAIVEHEIARRGLHVDDNKGRFEL